jgi:protein TonB
VDPTETEALKQHTARLQDQLSNVLFSGAPAKPATVSVQIPHVPPVTTQKELAETSRISKPDPAPAKPVEPLKLDPPPVKLSLSLEDEELKIPSWLEPLARNAAAPTSTQELIEREKAKRLAEQPKVEQIAPETVPVIEELQVPELPLPEFDDSVPADEETSTDQSESKSSSKGMLFGAIAAGLLLLVGGTWWYVQRQSAGVHSGPVPAPGVQASLISTPTGNPPSQPQVNTHPQTNPPEQTNVAALTNTSAPSNSASHPLSVVPAVTSVAIPRNSQPTSNPASGGTSAPSSAPVVPAIEQLKKPILGEVHLATPKVKANRNTQNSEPDAGIALNEGQPGSDAEALNGGLVDGGKQPSAPAAPLAVGGDVKQAKLINSVSPVYPAMAKSQHISGNVLVDALIDANGKVTTMKVVSGPALLHQAAMDALKQWKYQPAMLDGKPVPMHLSVTLQFRLP